ncbi:MAG TPA: hypothetical protein VL326_15085 [Kofleriaceae bacterium]|nr:hypothetical protein [Kofleriaceae bacterium]
MRCLFLWIGVLAACETTVDNQKPVGGHVDSQARLERYVRHAYLDLSGLPPSDDDMAAATARLHDQGNTAAARGELIDELTAKDAFATLWVEELENSIFGGNTLAQQYQFICSIVKGQDRSCDSCTNQDPCTCACGALPMLATERTDLAKTTSDFHSGVATSSIERRYAAATGYFALNGTPENRVTALFDDFLVRTAEGEEIENGRAMIIGAIIPNTPAGLLFHRYGSSYKDLIDIVFSSEIYREAMVRRVFNRYLSREPSSVELAYFATTLDATKPDMRGLVHAVLSSREYFDQ